KLVRIIVETPLGSGNPDFGQERDRPLAQRRAAQIRMRGDGLGQLLADAVERVEAGERILKDHADAFAANAAHGGGAEVVDARPGKKNLAGGDAARRLD